MSHWFKNTVTMQIFVDRYKGNFAGDPLRPEFLGGNLRGIIDALDYLEWLGVNCLWLTPFYKTSAYHGYHVTDLFRVDPHFGRFEDLLELTEKAHRRGLRLIADFVPNHVSYLHPFFTEAQAGEESPYYRWFYFNRWPDDYLCFLHYKQLPKLNLRHKPCAAHVVDAAKFWLSCGFDGLRLDHAIGPDCGFWSLFRRELKKDYPEAVLIGEVSLAGLDRKHLPALGIKNKRRRFLTGLKPEHLYLDYKSVFDGVLDFVAQGLLKDFAAGQLNKTTLALKLEEHFLHFPSELMLPVFLDNHDTDRILFSAKQDKRKLQEAAEILFSLNQPVILYYGSEIGMTQRQSIYDRRHHGDLLARQPMEWDGGDQGLVDFFRGAVGRFLRAT